MKTTTDDNFPTVDTITPGDLLRALGNARYAYLSPWESSFCQSLREQLQAGRTLSEKQLDVLRGGLLHRLLDNDPELWGLRPLGLFNVEVSFDRVRLDATEVPKPGTISATDWIEFWEKIAEFDYLKSEDLERRLELANREISELQSLVNELKNDIFRLKQDALK